MDPASAESGWMSVDAMVPVQVQGLGVLPSASEPMMLLREISGTRRWIAIAIGTPEAEALVAAQARLTGSRPSTIELIGRVIGAFGRRLVRVEVTHLDEGIFHADMVMDDGVRISSRPSDAVAIALRAEVPVEVAETVLNAAGLEIVVVNGDIDAQTIEEQADPERQIHRFRDELDGITPDDFRDPGMR